MASPRNHTPRPEVVFLPARKSGCKLDHRRPLTRTREATARHRLPALVAQSMVVRFIRLDRPGIAGKIVHPRLESAWRRNPWLSILRGHRPFSHQKLDVYLRLGGPAHARRARSHTP